MSAGLVTLLIVAVLFGGSIAVVLFARIVEQTMHWFWRMLVLRAAFRTSGEGRPPRLAGHLVARAVPVRLTGLGSAAHRLDLSLIERQPDLPVADIRAADLGPLRGASTYLVFQPTGPQLWVREGFSARQVATFDWEKLHSLDFLEHDPDGIGSHEEPYRGSVGTVRVFLTAELRLYFLVRVAPDPVVLYDQRW